MGEVGADPTMPEGNGVTVRRSCRFATLPYGIAVTIGRSCFEPLLRLTSLWLFGIDIINRRDWYRLQGSNLGHRAYQARPLAN